MGAAPRLNAKGYVFESGATTLIGFDTHQPLARLESMLGITIPKTLISPGMSVHIDGKKMHPLSGPRSMDCRGRTCFWQSGRNSAHSGIPVLSRLPIRSGRSHRETPPSPHSAWRTGSGWRYTTRRWMPPVTAIRPEIRGPGDAGLRR